MNRRSFLIAVSGFLTACTPHARTTQGIISSKVYPGYQVYPGYRKLYGTITTEPFPIAAVDLRRINPVYLRRKVSYSTSYPPGTIIIDPEKFFCYFILPGGQAMRYGVGVAYNQSANFRGQAIIGRKAAWPHWTPTKNMMHRQPERYGHLGGGLPPGPTNPLGARAFYLYRNGKDTMFRLHGTTEPWSIGTNVSSGCIRFFNHDIIDLYNRVPAGSQTVVLNS